MTEHPHQAGQRFIIVGRTESTLAKPANTLGHSTSYYVLDTGSIARIPSFITKIKSDHPEVDYLINKAGVQRALHVSDFDLSRADQEIDINIRGPMHLAIGFLSHFQRKPSATIINVTSVLSYITLSTISPVYNGTKAWLHSWTINFRQRRVQGADTKNIKVVEIAPPIVSTDFTP